MVIAWAISWRTVVLPALGGETIRPRWPLPIGAIRSTIRVRMPLALAFDLETEPLVGEQRRQRLELGPPHRLVGGHPVDLVDADDGGELLLGTRRPDRAGDDVALAETELSHLIGGDIDVLVAGEIPGDPQEAVALGKDVEQALAGLEVLLGDVFVLATATATATPATVAIPVPALTLVVVVGAAALT